MSSACKNVCYISQQELATAGDERVLDLSNNIDNRKKFHKITQPKFSMKELLKCLPKRSYFDCHANALRERLNSEGQLENQARNLFKAGEEMVHVTPNGTHYANGLPHGGNADIKDEFLCNSLANGEENKEVGNVENLNANLKELDGKIDLKENIKDTTRNITKKKLKEGENLNSRCLLEYLQFIRDNDHVNPFTVGNNIKNDSTDDIRIKLARCFESQHQHQYSDQRRSKLFRAALQLNLKWKPVCQSVLLRYSDTDHHKHCELARRTFAVYQWMEKVTTEHFMKERNKVLMMLGEDINESRRNLFSSRYIRLSSRQLAEQRNVIV